MSIDVTQIPPADVASMRERYRAEMNCQIIHDAWFARGWTDAYRLMREGRDVGYGLVGGVRGEPKDTIIEYYVAPADRAAALPLFRRLIAVSGARAVESQTNDTLLTLMLYDCAERIEAGKVLFHDMRTTNLSVPGATFRRIEPAERANVFPHNVEPVGDWGIELGGGFVATGGITLHYNPPFGDIHMEVAEPFRRRGIGSYLVQELKRICREMDKTPAARCDADNVASRATLQKAGLLPCARMLRGILST